MLFPVTAYGQDKRLDAQLAACQRSGDAKCIYSTLIKIVTSPKHVAWCKSGSPEAEAGCLIYSVWLYCSADLAAEVSDAQGKRNIAKHGRETLRRVFELYGDVTPISELPKNYLILADALFDLIEAEACRDMGDGPCLKASAEKVVKADKQGAYRKYAMKQCWPDTGGVPKKRINAVVKAAKGNP